MAKSRQVEPTASAYLADMWSHFLQFLKWSFMFISITSVYCLVCYLVQWKYEVIYALALNLILPALWCKLRRYRIRDKSRLSFIYLMTCLSVLLQILINKGVFIKLQELLMTIGG